MASMVKIVLLLAFVLLAVSFAESKIKENVDNEEQYHLEKDSFDAHVSKYGQGSMPSSQCPGQCSRRCSRTQYKKPCLFFCQKCCNACLCVPTGFYGNKGECPCYNNWKTKRGGPKCP